MSHPRVQARVATLPALVTAVVSLAAAPLHDGSGFNAAASAGQRAEVLAS